MAKFFLNCAVDEPALGDAAGQGHLAALEHRADLEPLARGMALVPLARGLALARADPPADPLPLLTLMNALMDVVQLHQSVTPRRRAISSLVRSCVRALIAALTRFSLFVDP